MARTASLIADGRRGRLVREGLQVAIVGKPNVGKSSLFNALVGAARAIVTDVPGTTRDLVAEVVDIDGLRVTLVDTAGLRPTRDVVEAEGVARARQAWDVADLVLIVVDGSAPLDALDRQLLEETAGRLRLIVSNKSDLGVDLGADSGGEGGADVLSSVGADGRRYRWAARGTSAGARRRGCATTHRPSRTCATSRLLERAHEALSRARMAAGAGGDALLGGVRARGSAGGARGARRNLRTPRRPKTSSSHIFARFCIGK